MVLHQNGSSSEVILQKDSFRPLNETAEKPATINVLGLSESEGEHFPEVQRVQFSNKCEEFSNIFRSG